MLVAGFGAEGEAGLRTFEDLLEVGVYAAFYLGGGHGEGHVGGDGHYLDR